MVATVSNFLMFTVRLIMETVSIIIKIYHVNCSGPSVVSIHPAFPAQHISENRNSSSGATSNTQVSN
ncbi:unnamed protein product [Caenorhabditis nigoni]